MKVIIKTKSNYRNLNGKILEVAEVVGTRVSCYVWDEEVGRNIIADFGKSEVREVTYTEVVLKEIAPALVKMFVANTLVYVLLWFAMYDARPLVISFYILSLIIPATYLIYVTKRYSPVS